MSNGLAIIITARCNSARLPNKAVAYVGGQPLLYWIIRRLLAAGTVVVATTNHCSDDAIAEVAQLARVPCHRHAGDSNDVVGRMEAARQKYAAKHDYIMRGLGDCPFMAVELITRAADMMQRLQGEMFQWATAPVIQPVYGAREFPYDIDAWLRVVERSEQREHVDLYYHTHRNEFCTIYHEAPPNIYYRPYRLEVDWPEDLAMIRKIADNVGMLTPLAEIIRYLDGHKDVASLNQQRIEITGPVTSTDYATQRSWVRLMQGQPIISWDNRVWKPTDSRAQPVFCVSGTHLIGFASEDGILHTKWGKLSDGVLECECGQRIWHEPLRRVPSGSMASWFGTLGGG